MQSLCYNVRMKNQNQKLKLRLINVGMLVFAMAIVLSSLKLGLWLWDNHKAAVQQKYINSLVVTPPVPEISTETPAPTPTPQPIRTPNPDAVVSVAPIAVPTQKPTSFEWTVDDQYGGLFAKNKDMVGWLKIEGTNINYPVMQTGESDPEYYLTRTFEKKKSAHGTLFADWRADISEPSDNITIYGHDMKDDTMFAGLYDYLTDEFFEAHTKIQFDTKSGFGEYEAVAVFIVNPMDFPYHDFIDAVNEDGKKDSRVFQEFSNAIMRKTWTNLHNAPQYGDKLITLSTCANDNERLVLIAKRVSLVETKTIEY